MAGPDVVFVDANVMYSRTLMDWLHFMHEANRGAVTLVSSEAVFTEVLDNLRENKPGISEEQLSRTDRYMRELVGRIAPEGPPGLPFTGTDPDDYHVHGAATACDADYLLTFNRAGDFTADSTAETYVIVTPDQLLSTLAEQNPAAFERVVVDQHTFWAQREAALDPAERHTRDQMLERAGCPNLAAKARAVLVARDLPHTPAPAPGRSPAQGLSAALSRRREAPGPSMAGRPRAGRSPHGPELGA